MSRRDRKRGQRGRPPARRGRRRRARSPSARLEARHVLTVLAGRDRPLRSTSELLRALGLGRDSVRRLRSLLKQLEAAGSVESVERRYRLARPDGLVEGSYTPASGADPRGGSVLEDSGVVWQVADAADARAGDRVLVQPLGDLRRHRGEVLDVLRGQRAEWVGIFHRRGAGGFVTPYRDDGEWLVDVARGDALDARDGDVVVARPVRAARRPARGRAAVPRATGRVARVLGPPGHPEADVCAVVWRRRLRVEFPPDVLAAAEALPAELPAAEIARRADLRGRPFVTIDPASARDHDDALCVADSGGGSFRLWVAIADVSHFVVEGSAIDREALRRGNSVYFPDRAIPMLPERLSGDLCSLRPDVDRGVMVVELEVAADGQVERRSFYPAVIRSRARLVYEDVAEVMEGQGDGELDAEIAEQLRGLARVTKGLRRRRLADGSIDLDLPAPEIRFGPDGLVSDVISAPRTRAHRAVEDAMLAANRAVAEVLVGAAQPAVYRNHEPPLAKDVETLRETFARFDLSPGPARGQRGGRRDSADAEVPPPSWVAAALARVAGRPEERRIHQLVLRCMTRAQYGAAMRGHYALAFSHYTHFTSPIRRYADLVVHRALADTLEQRGRPERGPDAALRRERAWMQRVAGRISWRERVAVDAEREVVDLQRCAFLGRHVGEVHPATVTGTARFGLWLTLDPWFVEGLVHVSTLPEFVEYDEARMLFRAKRSGERFALGDRFDVRVEAVDQIQARIDFRIVARRQSPER